MPEVLLEPNRGSRAAEQDFVGAELRAHVGREEESVGVPSEQVVRPEDERERKPLEDDATDPATHVGQRKRKQPEQDPHEQALTRKRNPLAVDDDGEHDRIDHRPGEAQRAAKPIALAQPLGCSNYREPVHEPQASLKLAPRAPESKPHLEPSSDP